MTNRISLTLTKFQWNNLQKLYDYLAKNRKKVAPHFDMDFYIRTKDGNEPDPADGGELVTECGAVGCLIGHGIVAGIPAYSKDVYWDHYCDRVFGTHQRGGVTSGLLFNWLFDSDWSDVKPTLNDALKRLRYTLKYRAVPAQHELS